MKFRSIRTVALGMLAVVGAISGFSACSSDPAAKAQPCPATVDATISAKGNFHFSTTSLNAKAGPWTVKLVQDDPTKLGHTFELHGVSGKAAVSSSRKEACATFTLSRGEYTFFCGVSGHESSGMKGKLTVS